MGGRFHKRARPAAPAHRCAADRRSAARAASRRRQSRRAPRRPAPDEKWGETPCAFVELKPGAIVTADELRDYCREHMARYKVPKTFVFRELPKTSTGKIQKLVLRDIAKSASAIG